MTADQQAELAILRKYAGGQELQKISDELGIKHEVTVEVVSAVDFQRGRASELLRQREASLVTRKPGPPPVKQDAAPVKADAGVIETVLADAERAGGRFASRAQRLRGMLAELADDLADAKEVIDAEKKVERLRVTLANEVERLRVLKGGKPAAPVEHDGRAVRAWAVEQGIEVPKFGRVPRPVVEKYAAATGGTSNA